MLLKYHCMKLINMAKLIRVIWISPMWHLQMVGEGMVCCMEGLKGFCMGVNITNVTTILLGLSKNESLKLFFFLEIGL